MKFFTEIGKNILTTHMAGKPNNTEQYATEGIMVICARPVIIVIHRLKIE